MQATCSRVVTPLGKFSVKAKAVLQFWLDYIYIYIFKSSKISIFWISIPYEKLGHCSCQPGVDTRCWEAEGRTLLKELWDKCPPALGPILVCTWLGCKAEVHFLNCCYYSCWETLITVVKYMSAQDSQKKQHQEDLDLTMWTSWSTWKCPPLPARCYGLFWLPRKDFSRSPIPVRVLCLW